MLNETPEEEEIMEALKEVKDSAPGKDEIRISYIEYADERTQKWIIEMVKNMFEERANQWDQDLKEGHMVPIFKKGDRNDPNNYRGVVMLAMISRVLARVIAKRLSWWAEHMELMDEN